MHHAPSLADCWSQEEHVRVTNAWTDRQETREWLVEWIVGRQPRVRTGLTEVGEETVVNRAHARWQRSRSDDNARKHDLWGRDTLRRLLEFANEWPRVNNQLDERMTRRKKKRVGGERTERGRKRIVSKKENEGKPEEERQHGRMWARVEQNYPQA